MTILAAHPLLLPLRWPAQEAPQGTQAATGQENAPQGGSSTPGGGLTSMIVPIALIFAVFWFVMIGPERKQRKKREAMLGAIKKGDKVVTTSGMHATIAALQDDTVTLQADEGVRLRFSRHAIQTVVEDVPKDDLGKIEKKK